LLDGVHLPDVVRLPGQGVRRGGLAARRGGGQLPAGEPALQRAGAGQVAEVGVVLAQLEQHVGRAPGGMLVVQQQGLLDRGRGRGRGAARRGGRQSGGAPGPEAGTQGTDGPLREAELPRDGGGAKAALLLFQDAPPQRHGKGSRHGMPPRDQGWEGALRKK
jgi:hypothetical protein